MLSAADITNPNAQACQVNSPHDHFPTVVPRPKLRRGRVYCTTQTVVIGKHLRCHWSSQLYKILYATDVSEIKEPHVT